MRTPRARWWGYVRAMIRDYPELKLQQETPAAPPLSPEDRKVLDSVQQAIDHIQCTPNGPGKLKLIRYMYWSSHNIPGKTAAQQLGISEITAKRWHGAFVKETARCYGFSVPESGKKSRARVSLFTSSDQNF